MDCDVFQSTFLPCAVSEGAALLSATPSRTRWIGESSVQERAAWLVCRRTIQDHILAVDPALDEPVATSVAPAHWLRIAGAP